MSHNNSSLPQILDGKLLPAGQTEEADWQLGPIPQSEQDKAWERMKAELHQYLRNNRYSDTYAPFCSNAELVDLWNDEHQPWSTGHPRFNKELHERVIRICDKLPTDIIMKVQEKRLKDKKPVKTKYELGAREFTLTYSPKWMDDVEARKEMARAIAKLCKYYEDQIIRLRAVGEVGTNGLSHVHCFYKLKDGVKITDKNFKRAWKYWNPKKKIGRGFEGGHHANVREESDFLGYIDKCIDAAWLDVTACPLK